MRSGLPVSLSARGRPSFGRNQNYVGLTVPKLKPEQELSHQLRPEPRLKPKLWSRTLVITISLKNLLIMHTVRQECGQTVLYFCTSIIKAGVTDVMVTEDGHSSWVGSFPRAMAWSIKCE